MDKKHLSDVLKGQDIIAETNQRICIVSGVGSGKNTFIEKELVQYGNILYISSRRAKVNEILENNICSDVIQWEKEKSDIVSVTNYGIERIVQNKKFGHNLREIINHFDFIVVDEAHSLLTDATYANSSFHVFAFIEYVIAQYPKIKVILMTGTPEPIERYLNQKGYTVFDKRDECIHVLPKVIRVVNKDFAFECISRMPENEKTVYYSTSATRIVTGDKSLVKRLSEINITSDEIGICISEQSAKRLKKEYKGLTEKCAQTKEAILKKRMLPEKCRILLTTSCLKEGVNIENDNIKIAFCESHVLSEIQQFAGRIRKGLDVLYIISDANQHTVSDDELHQYYLELHYAVAVGKAAANEYLEKAIKNPNSGLFMERDFFDRGDIDAYDLYQGEYSLAAIGGTLMPMYIRMVESANPYLKFNHVTGHFDVFANKYIEQRRVNQILSGYKWLNDISEFSKCNGIEYLERFLQDEVSEEEIMEYCEENVDTIWIDEDKNDILGYLRYMMFLAPNAAYKTINKTFSMYRIPYRIETVFTSRDGQNKRGIRIVESMEE